MNFRGMNCAVVLALGLLLSACGGGKNNDNGLPVENIAPVANAGSAQSVTAGDTVTLDGSASSDANSDPLTYVWVLSSKPAGSTATLNSATVQKTSFMADLAGSYSLSLVVNDGKFGSSNAATVTITAIAPNLAPVADAGSAQAVTAGSTVSLDASASADANGDSLTYIWSFTSTPAGSTAVLASATAQKPTFIADLAGSYTLSLVVNDGKLSSNAATVTITAATPVVSAGNTGKLNDTGITAMGYDAAGAYLAACTGAAADNDCNTGRDITANDNSDGHAGFSFTKIAADGTALPASATEWSCVKDNVTGYIWENKTAANGALRYTNYDDITKAQLFSGSALVNPTQAQIDAATNSVGYKNAVNIAGLCGAKDWRLPAADELLSIVDDSVAYPGPAIDAAWFPNTPQNAFWSSSPLAGTGSSGIAWDVNFNYGEVVSISRNNGVAVRLVRSGQ